MRRTTAVKALLGAVVMVGAVAAAYTGALPGPIQKVAHITINAPAPQPGTRHPAVKPAKHGHARPTPVPHSQPASPPKRPAASSTPQYGPGRTPALPRASASASCGPGPWQPQDLPVHYPSAPSGSIEAHCPAPATPTPAPKVTGVPSWPAKPATKAA